MLQPGEKRSVAEIRDFVGLLLQSQEACPRSDWEAPIGEWESLRLSSHCEGKSRRHCSLLGGVGLEQLSCTACHSRQLGSHYHVQHTASHTPKQV